MLYKSQRIWVKQEKRTVRLLYRKGLIQKEKLKDFYWAEYHYTGKVYKKKKGNRHKYPEYMPEIHYSTFDYWGECTEHGLVSTIREGLYWEQAAPFEPDSGVYPTSTFKHRKSRLWFINYLKKLPTKVSDNKIRVVFKNRD